MPRRGIQPVGSARARSRSAWGDRFVQAMRGGKWLTTTSSSAAARPARSWPTGCRREAPTRCCCARPGRTRRTATCRRRSSIPIPAPPISTRASTGRNSRSTPQIVSHNRPDERPPLRKYEQARVLGGGSSINGQLANRGAPTDYDEWEAKGRRRAGTGTPCCPISRRSSATWISPAPITARTAASRCAASFPIMWCGHAKAVAAAFKEAGVRLYRGPERRIPRRLFPDHDLEPLRPPRLGRDRLSRRRDAPPPEPDDLGRDAGRRTAVRGDAMRRGQGAGRGQGNRVPRRSDRGEVIVSSGAIHSPAHLLRAGIGPARR